jgi:hypothetical protein
MKRLISLLLFASLSSLMTFQICEASEDAVQSIALDLQIAAARGTFVSTPPVSEDDFDANLPDVLGQTLTPGSVASLFISHLVSWSSHGVGDVSSIGLLNDPRNDRSPPGRSDALPLVTFHYSNQCFIACLRSLAPPAA